MCVYYLTCTFSILVSSLSCEVLDNRTIGSSVVKRVLVLSRNFYKIPRREIEEFLQEPSVYQFFWDQIRKVTNLPLVGMKMVI